MPTVKLQGGKVVTKDGKVSCECCGPPCASGSCSGFAVANITEAQANAIFAGGYWTFAFTWTRAARLEGYFREFANDPLIIYIAYNTNFNVSHTQTVFRSGCNFEYSSGNVPTFGRGLDFYTNGVLTSQTTGDFSGNASGSVTVTLRRNNSGGGYCAILSASMASGDTIHPKGDMSSGTIFGSTTNTGNNGCGTFTSVVLNPVIAAANGTHSVVATFSAGPP